MKTSATAPQPGDLVRFDPSAKFAGHKGPIECGGVIEGAVEKIEVVRDRQFAFFSGGRGGIPLSELSVIERTQTEPQESQYQQNPFRVGDSAVFSPSAAVLTDDQRFYPFGLRPGAKIVIAAVLGHLVTPQSPERAFAWWDFVGLEEKPNQPLQRNASTRSVSNFESPARRG